MINTALAKKIQFQYNESLPFVAYKKPNANIINAIFCDSNAIVYSQNLEESGFIMAPFDSSQKTILFESNAPEIYYLSDFSNYLTPKNAFQSLTELEEQKKQHINLVCKGISQIEKNELSKVVLSRKRTLKKENLDITATFFEAVMTYPEAMVYCWYHPKVGLWIGATPETLINTVGNRYQTVSLAGTQPYHNQIDVLWGEKEIVEQEIVTESIKNELLGIGASVNVAKAKTHKAGTLLHLMSEINGLIKHETALKDVVKILHPTPAVCGVPKEKASEFIKLNEAYDRSFYTGYLGEINIKSIKTRSSRSKNVEHLQFKAIHRKSHIFVNLRCFEYKNDLIQLYVGGGITRDSNPIAEWEETCNKQETMLNILK